MKYAFPLGIIALVVLVLTTGSFYTVDETEQVIITKFGRIMGEPITEPGLHFKIPFIHMANSFPSNILEWDGDPSQIPTLDKKYIWVDIFARWQIVDAVKYFKKVKNEDGAHKQMDTIINGATKNLIQSLPLIEATRNTIRDMEIQAGTTVNKAHFEAKIEIGREKITRLITERAGPKLSELGIQLIDVGIKRINFKTDVQKKVFERMIAERKQIAEKYRSEGQGKQRRSKARWKKS